MTFYNIKDVTSFMKRVSECQGGVFSQDTGRDMRPMAEYLLSSGMAVHMNGIDELNVTVEKHEDAIRLMRYMSEMTSSRSRRALRTA